MQHTTHYNGRKVTWQQLKAHVIHISTVMHGVSPVKLSSITLVIICTLRSKNSFRFSPGKFNFKLESACQHECLILVLCSCLKEKKGTCNACLSCHQKNGVRGHLIGVLLDNTCRHVADNSDDHNTKVGNSSKGNMLCK